MRKVTHNTTWTGICPCWMAIDGTQPQAWGKAEQKYFTRHGHNLYLYKKTMQVFSQPASLIGVDCTTGVSKALWSQSKRHLQYKIATKHRIVNGWTARNHVIKTYHAMTGTWLNEDIVLLFRQIVTSHSQHGGQGLTKCFLHGACMTKIHVLKTISSHLFCILKIWLCWLLNLLLIKYFLRNSLVVIYWYNELQCKPWNPTRKTTA
jgi:hypothetical protein